MGDAGVVSEARAVRREEARSAGAEISFSDAVASYQSLVFSIAYHLLRNSALAEEVAQEVFLRLYQDLAKVESQAHLVHWLRRTTTHRCLDVLRRDAGRSRVTLEDVDVAAPTAPESDPWLGRKLRALVGSLPAETRAVVVLRYQEDLEPREIAQMLDLPVNTIKSRLQRALVVLRGRLGALEEKSHGSTRS